MGLYGACSCKNIELKWQLVDYSLVPRACQCAYCLAQSAAYVSKSGTRVDVTIRRENFHRTIRHGSHSAVFHECSYCDQLLLVTAEIGGELYGALNAGLLVNPVGFGAAHKTDFSGTTAEQKCERWRRNWCHPIVITTLA